MTLIDFTLSDARGFYSSMGNPSDIKGLRKTASESMFTNLSNCSLQIRPKAIYLTGNLTLVLNPRFLY